MNEYKIMIGIPTINSELYIDKTIKIIKNEIELLPQNFKCKLVICINGYHQNNKIENKIKTTLETLGKYELEIIKTEIAGKNNALNLLINKAKNLNYDIIHFFDDDIMLEKGALLENLTALINHHQTKNTPVLVASNFFGHDYDFKYFLKKEIGIIKALSCWFFHNIFITPFTKKSDIPNFCAGASICSFVSTIPELPDDSKLIADYAFLSNYYAVKGKNTYYKEKINPIIKPINSIVYFKIPTNFNDWWNQQIRTYIGCINAYYYFENELTFFYDYFSWSYAYHKEFRRKPPFINFKRFFFYILHFILRGFMMKKARLLMKKKRIISWGTAISTKTYNE